MYNGLPGTPIPSPKAAEASPRGGRGRGRGAGRGTRGGSVRAAPTGTSTATGAPRPNGTTDAVPPRGSARAPRARHSSYTPSGGAARPLPSNGQSPPPDAVDITRSPTTGRGRGRGAGMGVNLRSPGTVSQTSNRPNSTTVTSLSSRRGGSPSSSARGGRPLPKFSDVEGGTDEPTPPPRSPPITPRMANLPALPPRPSTPSHGSAPAASPAASAGSPAKEVSPEKEAKRSELRRKCVTEIYETEKGYIDDLEILINVFIFPMRTMASVDEKTLYAIFSNVEVLINCNKEMLAQLEKVMHENEGSDDVVIGFVFTQLADYFKMYKVFCANQGTSLSTVESMTKKNAQFKKILDVCHGDVRCRGLFLQSFLIKPIQRVCKYPLLLRELIRYTPESHPDWEPLQSAFTKINSVVADINEAQRQAEGLQRILDLQSLIDGVDSLVAPGRNYVKEGELTQYKSSKSKSGEKRHVFFFTDLIILTLRRGEKKFEHKLTLDLDSCTLVVLADSSYIKNSFELSTGDSKGKKCILSGETPDESNQWIKEIRGLIKSYQKRKLEDMRRAEERAATFNS